MTEDIPSSPNNNLQGGHSFAPPPSNVFIRTSDSDFDKLKSEGGEVGFDSQLQPQSQQPPFSSQPQPQPQSQQPPFSSQPQPQPQSQQPPFSSQPQPQPQPTFSPPPPSTFGANNPMGGSTPASSPMPKNTISSPNPVQSSPDNKDMSISPEVPSSELSSFSSSLTVPPKRKNKYLPFLIGGGIVIAGVIFGYFYLWPKIFKPKPVIVTTTTTTTIPVTTTTTVISSPYPQISGPYQKASFPIKIAGPTIAATIKEAALGEPSTEETFKVLIPKIHNDALTGEEVILSLIPKLPQRLKPYLLGRKYMLYVYYGKVNPSLGLIVDIGQDNKDSVKSIFSAWAKGSILDDLKNFFLVKIPPKASNKFKEDNLAGAELHYLSYKGTEAAMSYAFFDRYLIISSSQESINSAINHLQGVTEPIIP